MASRTLKISSGHLVCLAVLSVVGLQTPTQGAEKQPLIGEQVVGSLIRHIQPSADGQLIITAAFDGRASIRKADGGRLVSTWQTGHGKAFWSGWSDDGRIVVSGGEDGIVRTWDPSTHSQRGKLDSHKAAVWTGDVTRNGGLILTGGPDGQVILWNANIQRPERFIKHSGPVWWLDVSSDDQLVAVSGGDGKVSIYTVNDAIPIRTFGDHAGGIYCVAWSPDSKRIATAGADAKTKIWSKEGQLLHVLPQFGAVHAVTFSPDGKRLATGGADYSVRLWDADRGRFLSKLTGHTDVLWTLAFRPGTSQLMSSGADKTIRFWDTTETPEPRRDLPSRVDLRPQFKRYRLEIVAQGPRPTCSVHTFTRALEFAASKSRGQGVELSDEYLNWGCNHLLGRVGPKAVDQGHFFEHLWMGYCRYGVCRQQLMPFERTFDPKNDPSEKARQNAMEMKGFEFAWHDISGPGVSDESVVQQAKAVLDSGWPLLAGSTHSLLIVGYRDGGPGGGTFTVWDSGTGGAIEEVMPDPLHSAISYSRISKYGVSWIECIRNPIQKPSP